MQVVGEGGLGLSRWGGGKRKWALEHGMELGGCQRGVGRMRGVGVEVGVGV